jgi:type IV pilus assembly protein PilE
MKNKGFTLTEVMIVMAVVTILGTVAIPSYTGHLKKSARQEAKQLLLQSAVRQETHLIRNGQYANNMTSLGYGGNSVATDSGRYNVSVSASSTSSYTLSATPTSTGNQNSDPCGTFTLKHTGERGISTSADPAPTAKACWN